MTYSELKRWYCGVLKPDHDSLGIEKRTLSPISILATLQYNFFNYFSYKNCVLKKKIFRNKMAQMSIGLIENLNSIKVCLWKSI